jgi:DNA-binding IclR family transcriptional regulator
LIAELVDHGLLERGPDREVLMGRRMWELGLRASSTLSLRDAAMPYLSDLHAVVGHHVQLGVLDGDDVLFVERLTSRDAVINYTRIAGRMPLHTSSSGLVLLAFGSDDLQRRILSRPLIPYTAKTITSVEKLRAMLVDVRNCGFALLPGHIHESATGVAVPVRDGLNVVVAALSVIVPNDGRATAQVSALMAGARGITRSLQARPPA